MEIFFESLIGAIYLDRGYLYCENLFKRVIIPYVFLGWKEK
jgi:ribonuclease-3